MLTCGSLIDIVTNMHLYYGIAQIPDEDKALQSARELDKHRERDSIRGECRKSNMQNNHNSADHSGFIARLSRKCRGYKYISGEEHSICLRVHSNNVQQFRTGNEEKYYSQFKLQGEFRSAEYHYSNWNLSRTPRLITLFLGQVLWKL